MAIGGFARRNPLSAIDFQRLRANCFFFFALVPLWFGFALSKYMLSENTSSGCGLNVGNRDDRRCSGVLFY
jgi:hypothetical protein